MHTLTQLREGKSQWANEPYIDVKPEKPRKPEVSDEEREYLKAQKRAAAEQKARESADRAEARARGYRKGVAIGAGIGKGLGAATGLAVVAGYYGTKFITDKTIDATVGVVKTIAKRVNNRQSNKPTYREVGEQMVTMKELMESVDVSEGKDATSMRDWVIHQVEKTDRTHDDIKSEFIKKFGMAKLKTFEKIVSEIVD